MNTMIATLIIGTGATVTMDLWGLARKALLGIALPDYRLVGRWIGHMPHGRFRHDSIATASVIRGERLTGWTVHYLVGISFAALLIAISGVEWIQQPTLIPAISVGLATVAAPFLLMQPGMGSGIAAARSANPASARVQSLITHAVFGVGLYLTAWMTQFMRSL